jgi:hypothetical protein
MKNIFISVPLEIRTANPSSTNLHTNMLSVSIGAHKYAACFYWRPPSCYLCAQQHKFRQKYGKAFYWVKICIACWHVGQMLFAGNKYLLLKRITLHSM